MKRAKPKAKKTDKTARRNELRRALRMAAITLDPERGGLAPLAEKTGCTEFALYAAINRAKVSPLMAIALEHAVGRDLLTREFLCPEKFK